MDARVKPAHDGIARFSPTEKPGRAVTEADSADRRAAPARMEPWLKLAALVLVVAALGLPVNDLFRYALLVIATVVVVTGTMRDSSFETPHSVRLLSMRASTRWLAAIAAVTLCIAGHILFPAPRIEEGH